ARDVILADVPWASAIDFYNILAMQSSWRAAGAPLRVHILSQDWFCASLEFNPQKRAFEANDQAARALVTGGIDRPSAAQAAAVLRRQDSLLFWKEAAAAYLNEPVRWHASANDEISTIWGYIDLNFALARPVVQEIVRRAVRRTVSSFTAHSVNPADDIIARILGSDFERSDPNPGAQGTAERTVLAGSVLGSGNTLHRFVRGVRIPYAGVLQLLRHPGFPRSGRAELIALDWLPPKSQGRRNRPAAFERVPNTPFVIRGGESVVPLAGFARNAGDGQAGRSLYGERPADAYQRWQRLGILRMGHWTYGFNHDLLTLRLADALIYDAAEGGTMLNWLAARIREWIPQDGAHARGFVVYAQHTVTSELALVLSRHAALADIPFFPAAAASSQGKAALLLSPMTREAMIASCRDKLASGGSAVILDDAIVSGVTMRTVRQAVEGIWEGLREIGGINRDANLAVRTLAIVDRSGEPAQRALVERDLARDRRYWRWDVPSLGHSGSCVLCGLHARWQALASAVHGSLLKQRLDQWLTQWAATPVEGGRFDTGVPARRLQTQTATRFGIDPGKRAHLVTHSLAVSRVSIAAEIAGATTRKDYPLRKAREALASP
ncbi:MAG TPA: hypothetical protein VM915_17350, partial [Verrucomicrobiae bacterium]|nr:hypothetical protein [Verrucomicrobiae bacterium]